MKYWTIERTLRDLRDIVIGKERLICKYECRWQISKDDFGIIKIVEKGQGCDLLKFFFHYSYSIKERLVIVEGKPPDTSIVHWKD